MRVAYTQSELVGTTELAKGFGGFMDKIVDQTLEKIAIVRHNKPEAVIIPIAEYERMKELSELIEDMEIASIIAERDPDGMKKGTFTLQEYRERRALKGQKVV